MIKRIAALLAFAATVAAQTMVVGTGDPLVDVGAVQAAVARGGQVVLQGRFSFENPPVMRAMLPGLTAMVLVSKEVTISGTWNDRGEMTSIRGGEIPFAIEAPASRVRIERLRFLHPRGYAIVADAVGGLEIESCAIEAVEPAPPPDNPSGSIYGYGIYVASLLGLPSRHRPGQPENIYGRVSIVNNRISIGGTAEQDGMGIMVTSAGTAEKPDDVDISGNTIRNATKKGINVKQIGGQARIERNIVTSSIVYTGHTHNALIAGIHVGGAGSYRVAHNRIDYADPDGAGIRVRSFPRLEAAVEGATVVDNDVTMSAAQDAMFGSASAGIEIRGLARRNVVERNTIRGRARSALSLEPDSTGEPAGNTLDRNDHRGFIPPRGSR
jgi:hypothetical protein